jgi:hypothetical protein
MKEKELFHLGRKSFSTTWIFTPMVGLLSMEKLYNALKLLLVPCLREFYKLALGNGFTATFKKSDTMMKHYG